MQGLFLKLTEIPKIGFAHHFQAENYQASYMSKIISIELVYIKSGSFTAELYGKNYDICPGSILVLPRTLPLTLTAEKGVVHTHCTVQLLLNTPPIFIDNADKEAYELTDGIVLPFITPPCPENESIKKELYAIISSVGTLGKDGKLSAALGAMGILAKLNRMYRQAAYRAAGKASLLEYKIKSYVSANIHKQFTIAELAQALGKTPNYLNSVFKQATGIGIRQYINREKVHIISTILESENLTFRQACESVAIYDVSYGYRLFKKQTGITPAAFAEGKHLKPN